MTCNEIENRLTAYLENLLHQKENKDIEEHLIACPSCSQALSDLKQTEKLVKGLADVEPPPFFEQRIMARVREEAGQKQGFLQRFFRPLHIKAPIQVLATLLIAILGFYVFQKGDPEMKQLAPIPLPMAESGKVRVPDVLPLAPAASAVVKPTLPSPAGDIPGNSHRQFAAPPLGSIGKADKSADMHEPIGEASSSALKSAAPVIQAREKEIPAIVVEASSDRARDRAEKRESRQSPDPLLLEQKRKGKAAEPGVAVGEGRNKAAALAPSQQTAKADAKLPNIELTIYVEDTSVALRKIEERLGQVNARILDRKHREGKELLNAEIPTHNVAAFMDRIEGIGRVSLEKRPPVIPDRHVTVLIEIVTRP